ncbi:phage antirepressor N-terminal domain-containing protein [Konateibacter massiliensis]|uniref:phage antirepressor N-terminal domain-containing protein n=1 Tax=Konateibacter massiliensis TaxID=2002841 RepID=UPI0015D4BA06|nr:phage antirepressor N-terminal domain-containing protein [Konateibacter massiliensis]
MKTEVKEIPFNGNTLLGVKDASGQVWLAVKKVCLDIGLSEGQAQRQITNIQEEEPLKSNCCKFAIVQTEGNREIKRKQLFLNEKVVTLWLAKISLTPTVKRKSPEAYNKLLKYQLEAADILHKAFYETEEQKTTLNSKMGLEGHLEILQVQINNMENMLETQTEKLDRVVENMTLSTRQQQKLYKAAKDRINYLLGGAHSKNYKANAKSYFINLWNSLKSRFECGRYKDLNPIYYNEAFDFISEWEYTEA